MDYITTVLLLLSFIWTCIHILRRKSSKLPPGPYLFPVVGNIFQLGNQPHISLTKLSKSHGPLMSLKLGTITAIVVSSPELAKQVLHDHDLEFSSRSIPHAARALNHHEFSMPWLPVSTKWRQLRKICKEHLFSTQRLDSTQQLRTIKVKELLEYVQDCCSRRQVVDISKAVFTTTLNLLSHTFFSIDFADYNSNSVQDFKEIVWAVMELGGKPNLVDFFPVLKSRVDLQGIDKQINYYGEKLFTIFDGIIDQRLRLRSSPVDSSMTNDVLDALLDLTHKNESEFSRNDINHLLMDLFIAGTDTSSITVEWAMAELLQNPEKLTKAQTELEKVIINNEIIEESDISRLPYLHAIVKETFRLHPPTPFLLPHKADIDVELNGFMAPRNAKVLVNIWAMGRDSRVWTRPNEFEPERFMDCDIEYRGHSFELIPFGSGRRVCPGLLLAHRIVHVMLASLLYSFNWDLEEPKYVDMSEKFGLTLQKAMPLKAFPIVKM